MVPGDAIVPGHYCRVLLILLNRVTSLVVKFDVKHIASTVKRRHNAIFASKSDALNLLMPDFSGTMLS